MIASLEGTTVVSRYGWLGLTLVGYRSVPSREPVPTYIHDNIIMQFVMVPWLNVEFIYLMYIY